MGKILFKTRKEPQIAITGSSGYIGSSLCKVLTPSYTADLTEGRDIRNSRIQDSISSNQVVINLAALSGLAACNDNPKEAHETNTKAAITLAERCSIGSTRRLIFASTSAVYGEASEYLMKETHPTTPRSIYGQTKLEAESILDLASSDFKVIIIRKSNVYGAGTKQKEITVIDKFLESYLQKRHIRIMGDGSQKRDFLHVMDAVALYKRIATARTVRSGIYNVGGNDCLSVRALAEMINDIGESIFGYRVPIEHIPSDGGMSSHDFKYDWSKTRMEFQYNPVFTIDYYVKERMLGYMRT